jgi:hypothetical protein
MIIIKTNNGDIFVNERTTQIVQHDRKNKMVIIRSPKEGPNCSITDVEGIIYTNDAQPTSWQDEGSALEKARNDNNQKNDIIKRLRQEKKAVMDDLLHFAFGMEQLVCNHHSELPNDVRQLIQKPALELKSKVLNHGYDTERE